MVDYSVYKKMVYAIIRQMIGGTESFGISEEFINECYRRGYHPHVPASCAVAAAVTRAKRSCGEDEDNWDEWVLTETKGIIPSDPENN